MLNNDALQVATREGNLEMVLFLVSLGCDVHSGREYALRAAIQTAFHPCEYDVFGQVTALREPLHAVLTLERSLTDVDTKVSPNLPLA